MKSRVTYLGAVAVALAVSAMVQPLAAQSRSALMHPPANRIAKPPVLVRGRQPFPSGPWEGTLQLSTSNGQSWSKTASITYTSPCGAGTTPAGCGTNPVTPFVLRWADDPTRISSSYYTITSTQLNPPRAQTDASVGCDSPNNFTKASSYQVNPRPNLEPGVTLVCQYVVTVTDADAHGNQSTRTTQPVTISIQVRPK